MSEQMSKQNESSLGFTLIELLMVIVIIAVLAATAIPQFMDFRKEARAAALMKSLATMRVGLKNQTQQSILRCGLNGTTLITASGTSYASQVASLMNNNDITLGNYICTAAQVVNPNERQFWAIDESEKIHRYNGLVATGEIYPVPQNPFFVPIASSATYPFSMVTQAEITARGGRCAYVDFIRSLGGTCHWYVLRETLEIFPGTNTPAVKECDY